MLKQLSPCRDCQDRQLGCHSDCDKYKEWKNFFDADKKKYQDDKEKQKQAREVVKNACNNMRTRKASNKF